MDNATFHKRKDTQEMIKSEGHTLFFLSPYFPDLNPIEKKWALAKLIRKSRQCSIGELFQADVKLYSKHYRRCLLITVYRSLSQLRPSELNSNLIKLVMYTHQAEDTLISRNDSLS